MAAKQVSSRYHQLDKKRADNSASVVLAHRTTFDKSNDILETRNWLAEWEQFSYQNKHIFWLLKLYFVNICFCATVLWLGVERTETICVGSGIGYIGQNQDQARVGCMIRCGLDVLLNIFSFI